MSQHFKLHYSVFTCLSTKNAELSSETTSSNTVSFHYKTMGNKSLHNKEMRTYNLTTLACLFHLAPIDLTGTEGPVWAAKIVLLLWTTKQIGLDKKDFLHNQESYLGKSPYKVPPPWIKYLKLQLVNSTFDSNPKLNMKWSSPVTLTVALGWISLNQVTVVWPHTTKPAKCILVLNSEIIWLFILYMTLQYKQPTSALCSQHLIVYTHTENTSSFSPAINDKRTGLFYKVVSLTSTLCSYGKNYFFVWIN